MGIREGFWGERTQGLGESSNRQTCAGVGEHLGDWISGGGKSVGGQAQRPATAGRVGHTGYSLSLALGEGRGLWIRDAWETAGGFYARECLIKFDLW